jgi:hypothetical protein
MTTEQMEHQNESLNSDDGTHLWRCLSCSEETYNGWEHMYKEGHCSFMEVTNDLFSE